MGREDKLMTSIKALDNCNLFWQIVGRVKLHRCKSHFEARSNRIWRQIKIGHIDSHAEQSGFLCKASAEFHPMLMKKLCHRMKGEEGRALALTC